MLIREMQSADLDFAAECTATEGWISETKVEINGLSSYDPSGCFIAEIKGRRIGMCVATCYGESAFVGELIVLKEMRRQGIGRKLIEHAIRYLLNRGAKNVLLDGVPTAIPLYERIGFIKICRSIRFGGKVRPKMSEQLRQMKENDLGAVFAIDRRAFGADRGYFLRRRLLTYPELCKVVLVHNEIVGYVMGRRGYGIVSVGPWVIQHDSLEDPGIMVQDIASNAGSAELRLGVLESNAGAVRGVRSLGLAELPDSPWRMLLGASADLGSSNQCYAIGSPAKG